MEEQGLVRAHPEWDDVKALAAQSGAPALEIYATAGALAGALAREKSQEAQ